MFSAETVKGAGLCFCGNGMNIIHVYVNRGSVKNQNACAGNLAILG